MKSLITNIRLQFNELHQPELVLALSIPTAGAGGRGKAEGGTGRARKHIIENLITLCLECHGAVHRSKEMREWTLVM